jgi:transglutaminase-like putative cysteine protease
VFLEIEHRFSFDYDAFVRESFIELRMQPKTTPHQTLHSFVLAVGPPTTLSRYRDWNDNLVHHFTVTSFHDRIAVASRALVATHLTAPPLGEIGDPLPLEGLPYPLWDFLQPGGPIRAGAPLRKFGASVPAPVDGSLGALVRAVGRHVHREFEYRKHVTRVDSTTDDFLAAGAGVCQDFTHLTLGLLRLRGVPCRYVSGYLHVEPKDGEVAQSHAWIEFFSPTRGWIPFDPTHDREIDERYVTVGHGRHYEDVPPNKGIFRGNARETLTAEVYTRPSVQKDVSTLREEIEAIDLPVFQEIPDRARAWTAIVSDDAIVQQQQQQQQTPREDTT